MEIMGWEGWRDMSGWVCWWGGEGMNAFFTPPSHSTAQLIEASVCLFQLLCFLSSLTPPPTGAGRRIQPPPALVSCLSMRVRVKWPIFVELALLLCPHHPTPFPELVGLCDIGMECVDILAVVTFNDCTNERLMKSRSVWHIISSLLSLTRLPWVYQLSQLKKDAVSTSTFRKLWVLEAIEFSDFTIHRDWYFFFFIRQAG